MARFSTKSRAANRRVARVTAVLLLLGLTIPVDVAASGDGAAEAIEGTYETTKPMDAVREQLNEEVEEAVQQMSFYKRPWARSQLKDATEPCREVTFRALENDRISIQCDDRPPATSPRDGSWTDHVDENGDELRLSQTVKSDRVIQKFESDNGMRTNVYRLEGDTVSMDAKLESSQLPEPVTFQRTFERND